MNDQTLRGCVSICHIRQRAGWTNQHTNVSDLSATLRVERRAIEHYLAFLALAQRFDFITFNNRDDLRIIDSRRLVAFEYRTSSSRELCINQGSLYFGLSFFICYNWFNL